MPHPPPPHHTGLRALISRVQTDEFDVVSTDVFDTLLLRTLRSERARLWRSETLFCQFLHAHGYTASPVALIRARLIAQDMAFRALRPPHATGEARLEDIIQRQLRLLDVPQRFLPMRNALEVETELSSLRPHGALLSILDAARRQNKRIVALSDTILSGTSVHRLIRAFYGDQLINEIYTSADLGHTKRSGEAFSRLTSLLNVPPQRVLHIGDDIEADYARATQNGLCAHYVPRPSAVRHARRINGAISVIHQARRLPSQSAQPTYQSAEDFGRLVLGPIVAQFCLAIWLYVDQAAQSKAVATLFCARGGIGIHAAFEHVITKLELPAPSRRANIMISRIVAVRAAILSRSLSARDEFTREFQGATIGDAIAAIGDNALQTPASLANRQFCFDTFLDYLFSPEGAELLADLVSQNALFERHLSEIAGPADRIILCDTGLYGSTQRLLASTHRSVPIETIHFARANYKRMGEEHFACVAGLLVEQNGYTPQRPQSAILRYWHLIEALFEPAIPSVRRFCLAPTGEITADCGDIGNAHTNIASRSPLMHGVMAYLDTLTRDAGAALLSNVPHAWRQVRRAIVQPGPHDLIALDVGPRSRDFGRTSCVSDANRSDADLAERIRDITKRLWREGAIAREFPIAKHAILPAIDLVQSYRGIMASRPERE